MKVYVDELPKKCADCPFYKLDIYVDVYGYQTNSHECVLDGSMLTNSCPLQSLADYTKQVRKEVCEEVKEEVKKLIDKDFRLCNHEYANGYCYGLQYDLSKILEQIEKGEAEWE